MPLNEIHISAASVRGVFVERARRESAQPLMQLVAYAPKDKQSLALHACLGRRRVFKALVDTLCVAGEDRAHFIGVIAYRDDVSEFLSIEFGYVF